MPITQASNEPFNLIADGERIPALPAGVTILLEKLSDNEIDLFQLSDSIAEFPSIASRLIFLANSAWSAPLVPIDNLQHACSKLGLSVIRSVSIALSIANPFNPLLCKPFDTHRYWLNALMVGEVAKVLSDEYESIPAVEKSALQTAGILHNIGLLWLADRLPEQTALALEDYIQKPEVSLEEHLVNYCEYGYCAVNGKLAVAWNFPPLLHNIIRFHNTLDYTGEHHQQCHLIGLATAISDYVLSEDTEQPAFSDCRLAKLGLTDAAIARVLAHSAISKTRFREVISAFMQAY